MVEAGAYDANNFNQLLSYLGRMTPQQRAQVGQMHQNDFEVITALSFINSAEARAKQARATQQAMGQQPAPPVNQQVIAETQRNALPEEVGIGALPAPNIARMAGGGITGEVEHYSPGGTTGVDAEFRAFLRQIGVTTEEFIQATPKARKAIKDRFESQRTAAPAASIAPSAAPSAAAASKGTAYELGKKYGPAISKATGFVGRNIVPGAGVAYSVFDLAQDAEKNAGFYADPNVPTSEKIAQATRAGAKTALPVAGGAVGSLFAPWLGTLGGAAAGAGLSSLIDSEGRALQEWRKANPPAVDKETALGLDNFRQQLIDAQQLGQITKTEAEAMFADAVKRGTKNPTFTYREPTGGAGAPGAGPGAAPAAEAGAMPTASAAQPMTIDEMLKEYESIKSRLPSKHPAAQQLEELGKELTKGAQEDVAAAEARAKRVAERYKGREARYAEQEAKLAKDADANTGLALLTAAANVLQPGGLAAGLMKAANVAIPQYQAGLDKLKAAQDKINLGREHLEDLRYTSEDMTDREVRQAQTLARQAGIDAKKLIIQGLVDTQGITNKEAETLFRARMEQVKTGIEQTGATARTGMTVAGMTNRVESTEELRMRELAEKIRDKITKSADTNALTKYDPVARAQFIEKELKNAAQANPTLVKYLLGGTGGGDASSQSDPLGILGTKP